MTARHRILLGAALCALTLAHAGASIAQEWPTRSVRVVNPFPAGSASDIIARLLAEKLSGRLGQPFVVDNKPGASAIIGTEIVAKAPPDGYTLLVGGSTTHVGNLVLFNSLPYDPIRDFAPVAYINALQYYLVVGPALPVTSVKELIEYGKKNPGKLDYATGNATGTMGGEQLKAATGLPITQINYRGPPQGAADVVAGTVSMMFLDNATAGQLIKSARVRALAIAAPQRSQFFPDVPTLLEEGVSGIDLTVWIGVWAPAGTPKAIVDKVNASINAVLAMPDVVKRIADIGFTLEGPGSKPEDLERLNKRDIETWRVLVETAKIPKQ